MIFIIFIYINYKKKKHVPCMHVTSSSTLLEQDNHLRVILDQVSILLKKPNNFCNMKGAVCKHKSQQEVNFEAFISFFP